MKKVGTYIAKKDYHTNIIYGIVTLSIIFAMLLPSAMGYSYFLMNFLDNLTQTFDTPHEISLISNSTLPSDVKIMEEYNKKLDGVVVGMLLLGLLPIIIIALLTLKITNYILKKLGLEQWKLFTCRCCGKYTLDHEEVEK